MSRIQEKVSAQRRRLISAGSGTGDTNPNRSEEEDGDEALLEKLRQRQVVWPFSPPRGKMSMHLCKPQPHVHTDMPQEGVNMWWARMSKGKFQLRTRRSGNTAGITWPPVSIVATAARVARVVGVCLCLPACCSTSKLGR